MIDGSIFPPQTEAAHVLFIPVLTIEGIRSKHVLSIDEYVRLRRRLYGMKLCDILFAYPDGRHYDVALNLLATTR